MSFIPTIGIVPYVSGGIDNPYCVVTITRPICIKGHFTSCPPSYCLASWVLFSPSSPVLLPSSPPPQNAVPPGWARSATAAGIFRTRSWPFSALLHGIQSRCGQGYLARRYVGIHLTLQSSPPCTWAGC